MALKKQKRSYELAEGSLERAQSLMDLILLSVYILLPPARCLEVRTLQIFVETDASKFCISNEGNFLVIKLEGHIVIQQNAYKTTTSYGRDVTIIEVCP